MAERLAESGGLGEHLARQDIMDALGGIPVGRRHGRRRSAQLVAFPASDRFAWIHGADQVVDDGTIPTGQETVRWREITLSDALCPCSRAAKAPGFSRARSVPTPYVAGGERCRP